jgi:hypothetical protein
LRLTYKILTIEHKVFTFGYIISFYGETKNEISRRKLFKTAAASGIGLGTLSSTELSPVQSARASHDSPIEYWAKTGDEYEYRFEGSGPHHDGSIGIDVGVVQTGIADGSGNCGGDYWEHYLAVWATAIFTRDMDEPRGSGRYRSGQALRDQSTDISTTTDSCTGDGPLIYWNNRFVRLYGYSGGGACPQDSPGDSPSQTGNWFQANHKEDRQYDNYSDVKEASNEWAQENPDSEQDDFNSWDAGIGVFGGIIGAYTGGATTVGLASYATSGVSFFEALSEFGQGNGATVSRDNKQITFYEDEPQCGLKGNLIEFSARVPAGESYEITVENDFGVRDEPACYKEPLDSNVDSDICYNIKIPENKSSTDKEDASRIDASLC